MVASQRERHVSDHFATTLMSDMRDSQVVDDFRQATFAESRAYISALPLLFLWFPIQLLSMWRLSSESIAFVIVSCLAAKLTQNVPATFYPCLFAFFLIPWWRKFSFKFGIDLFF